MENEAHLSHSFRCFQQLGRSISRLHRSLCLALSKGRNEIRQTQRGQSQLSKNSTDSLRMINNEGILTSRLLSDSFRCQLGERISSRMTIKVFSCRTSSPNSRNWSVSSFTTPEGMKVRLGTRDVDQCE